MKAIHKAVLRGCFSHHPNFEAKKLAHAVSDQMDRASHETTAVHSSIALLQERFRQLQRVKAMREEREVLRMLAPSDPEPKQLMMMNSKPTMHYEPARLFIYPDHLVFPHGASPSRVYVSLWPTLQTKHDDFTHRKTHETPVFINLWPTVADTPSSNTCLNTFEDSESDSASGVDTSLHL